MAYNNRQKIHIARGTAASIVGEEVAKQSEGQPAFIEDKLYLTIGPKGGDKFFSQVSPIRVRTVEGWLSDKETDDGFTLSAERANHYILTGRNGYVYLATAPEFKLMREGQTETLSLLNKEAGMNETAGSYLLVDTNSYIKSNNIHTQYLKDLNGKDILVGNDSGLQLKKDTTISNNTFTSGKQATFNTKTIINNELSINATSTVDGTLNLNAETILAGNIHNSDSSLLIKPADASATLKTLNVTTRGDIKELYVGGTDINAALHITSDKIDINKPTSISSKLTVGVSSNAATVDAAQIYGTLTVNRINLITK